MVDLEIRREQQEAIKLHLLVQDVGKGRGGSGMLCPALPFFLSPNPWDYRD